MDTANARNVAHYSHVGQRDRFDEPVIEHVERVAAAVSRGAQPVAYLHDVVEHTDTDYDDLIAHGLTPVEFAALELLTRSPDESFELYVLRIAHAAGPAGDLARAVKLADLDDHLAHDEMPVGAPPYDWARLHIVVAGDRANGRAA
ncbi:MAG: metal-dependent phosphohydrolase [Thermoleophilaceae bacterium]